MVSSVEAPASPGALPLERLQPSPRKPSARATMNRCWPGMSRATSLASCPSSASSTIAACTCQSFFGGACRLRTFRAWSSTGRHSIFIPDPGNWVGVGKCSPSVQPLASATGTRTRATSITHPGPGSTAAPTTTDQPARSTANAGFREPNSGLCCQTRFPSWSEHDRFHEKGPSLDFAPFKAALRHSNPSSITEGRERERSRWSPPGTGKKANAPGCGSDRGRPHPHALHSTRRSAYGPSAVTGSHPPTDPSDQVRTRGRRMPEVVARTGLGGGRQLRSQGQ